ncbi:unnamed protein product [Coregonus sp. 'balchen']|nr:unnamed protein product [Coregonus sp. 'balchen']
MRYFLSSGVCCTATLSRLRQFHISENILNWTEARDYCQNHSADIATVYNQEESEQLIQLIKSKESCRAWIGLRRTIPSLKWSNGDTVNVTAWSLSNYTEPNCAAFITDKLWDLCSQNSFFMCYKKGVIDPSLRYTLVKENMTWYEAQSYCRENYTDLVSIRNEVQKEEVKNKGMNSTTPYWIGLLYDDWEWSDGGRSAYRGWANPPNDNCTQLLTYFSMPQKQVAVPCNNSPVHSLCHMVRIHISSERMYWEQALEYCNNNHDGLLRIETAEDLEAIKQKFKGTDFTGPMWVGLRQSRLFGFWVWTNGLPVGWSNWHGDKQPEQPLSNHCGAMATVAGYKWSDQDCLSKRFFICEE